MHDIASRSSAAHVYLSVIYGTGSGANNRIITESRAAERALSMKAGKHGIFGRSTARMTHTSSVNTLAKNRTHLFTT